jgi:hypothetical protein
LGQTNKKSIWVYAGNTDIQAVIINFDLTVAKTEWVVNDKTTGTQDTPTVACFDDGSFLIAWRDYNALDLASGSSAAKMYDATWAPISNQIIFNNYSSYDEYVVQLTPITASKRYAAIFTANVYSNGTSAGTIYNPYYFTSCSNYYPCPGNTFCSSYGVCIGCKSNSDCQNPTPICNAMSGNCEICVASSDCPDYNFGRCNNLACTTCTADADCTHFAGWNRIQCLSGICKVKSTLSLQGQYYLTGIDVTLTALVNLNE